MRLEGKIASINAPTQRKKPRASGRGGHASRRVLHRAGALVEDECRTAIVENPMPSFDAVSELDRHELVNAVDQANREIGNRFDFRGTDAKFELAEYTVTLEAPSDFQLKQMLDIFTQKLAARRIDVAAMDAQSPEITLSKAKQTLLMKHGIDTDHARKIVKLIKDSKLKVQAAIQGEQVRVTGKKRDDLQEAIRVLKAANVGVPLQFTNFRD
jgi:uncharacterized protein YajQ (UPF0234 family)